MSEHSRASRARRLLYLGAPALGVLLLPLVLLLEEAWGLSALFAVRGELEPPDDVVVVAIDEESSDVLDRPDVRLMHAGVVQTLARAGASVIVLDLFLHAASEYDEPLGAALRDAGNAVLIARVERQSRAGLDKQQLRVPGPVLTASSIAIAPWLVPEAPSVSWVFQRESADRYTVPFVALQAKTYDDFIELLRSVRPEAAAGLPAHRAELRGGELNDAMAALRRSFGDDERLASDLSSRIDGGREDLRALVAMYSRAPPFSGNRVYVNYYGRPRTVLTIPYQDVLASGPDQLRGAVEGRIALVGFAARQQPGQLDDFPYVYSVGGLNLSGVELAATVLANLLHGEGLELPTVPVRAALLLLFGFAIAAALARLRVVPGVFVTVAVCAVYLAGAFYLFRSHGVWLPLVAPAAQVLFAVALALRVKHLEETALLGSGTTEEAALALTGRGKPEKVDHRVILFADEQGSKKWLRRVLAELDDSQRHALEAEFALVRDRPITAHGGRINHLLADSMLAYWMTPEPDDGAPADAMNAAGRAALAIQAGVAAFNRAHRGYELALRLGLDWGRIFSRLNPSPFIKDWRMEGRAIHTAERLESLNKVLGTSVLVSRAIAERLDGREFFAPELGTFVFCDEQGDVVVDPVTVHELRSGTGVDAAMRTWAEQYASALRAMRQQDWPSALAALAALEGGPEPGRLASRSIEWCRASAKEPDCKWRGVIKVTVGDKSQTLERYV